MHALVCFSIATTTACLPRPAAPGPENEWHHQRVLAMDRSLRRIVGQALLPSPTASAAHSINLASSQDLILLSHDDESHPNMLYATQAALDLLEVDWDEFVHTKWQEWQPGSSEKRMLESDGQGFELGHPGILLGRGEQKIILHDAVIWDVHESTDDPEEFGPRLGQALMGLRSNVHAAE